MRAASLVPLAVLACAPLPLRGADATREIPVWWSPHWLYRKRIRIAAKRRGWAAVRFTTAGRARPDGGDVRIVADNTRAIPFQLVDAGREDAVLAAFPVPDPEREYAAYFGNPKATAARSRVTPKAGLILQVRALGEGDCDSWAAFRKLVDASREVLGADLRRSISLGFNPFGRERNYLAIYTGTLRIEHPGLYAFATNSSGPSFLRVDGRIAAEWPGWHDARGGAWGAHAGKIALGRGLHRLQYYYAAGPGGQGHVAGIQGPGAERPEVLSSKHFEPWVEARVDPIEALERLVVLDFDWTITTDGGYEGRDIAAVRFRDRSRVGRDRVRSWTWAFGDGQRATERAPHHAYLSCGVFPVSMTLDLVKAGRRTVTQRVWVRPVGRRGSFEAKLRQFAALTRGYDLRALSVHALENLVRILRVERDETRYFEAAQAFLERKPDLGDRELVRDAFRLGDHLRDARGRYREALAVYDHLARKAPIGRDRLRARVLAAEIRAFYTDEPDAARRALEDVLRRSRAARGDALRLAAVRLAALELERGDREAAERRIAAIESDPDLGPRVGDPELVPGRHAFAFTYHLERKEWVLAAKELRAWELEAPRVLLAGEIPLRRAELERAVGRPDGCLREVERVRRIAPAGKAAARALLLAAEVERTRGREERARELLREVTERWPGSPEADRARAGLEPGRTGGGGGAS